MSALPSDRYCGRGQSGRSAVLCVVSLAAAFSAVACSAEDSSRPQEATPTSITTSTTTSTTERTASLSPAPTRAASTTVTPSATAVVRPKDFRTGIGAVDSVLDALATGSESALIANLHFVSVPCMLPGPSLGGVPGCPDGAPVGSTVTAFNTGACHGVVLWQFDRLPTQLRPLLGLDLRVFAVAEIERLPTPQPGLLLPASRLLVLIEASPSSPFSVWVFRMDESGVVGVFNGCYTRPEDAVADGSSLGTITRVVVAPLR